MTDEARARLRDKIGVRVMYESAGTYTVVGDDSHIVVMLDLDALTDDDLAEALGLRWYTETAYVWGRPVEKRRLVGPWQDAP